MPESAVSTTFYRREELDKRATKVINWLEMLLLLHIKLSTPPSVSSGGFEEEEAVLVVGKNRSFSESTWAEWRWRGTSGETVG